MSKLMKSNPMKSVLQAVLGSAVLFASVAWLSGGCGERIGPEDAIPGAAPLAADAPRAGVVRERALVFEHASGSLHSSRHTTISSKILARIEEMPVRAGDVVERGTLVVRLDSRDLAARLRAAKETVVSAEAARELASSEFARITKLHAEQVASRQQLDRVTASRDMARAMLEAAEQAARDAEVGLSFGEIRSPVSGRVIDRLAEPGDTAAPGQALLHIYDPGALRLEAPVREVLATRLTPGQPLTVRVEALGLTLAGEIDEIVPAAEPGTRTFLVKVRLPADPRLFAGMFGRVEIPAGERVRLVVRHEAVERVGQLEYVRVVDGNGRVARRLVTTGPAALDGGVEVLSGLAAGEQVLLP
ncbi:MAG: efflux RND transporter periplasmic adaptor subunit [Deltaproteobacteria bacterium]|nr:efflux RND transporter periplasmic adaptor subunit [Deltaproteobacteria bacterium]